MAKVFYAHSGTPNDKHDWQGLKEHLLAVAKLAAEMARPLGLEKAAYLAGLFHDLGKYTADFQRRIEGAAIPVDHSTAGALLVLGDIISKQDWPMGEVIAYCIAGHHAGLPDRRNETPACLDRRVEAKLPTLDPIWKQELVYDAQNLMPEFARSIPPKTAHFELSLMGRMIFSCLVDADFKDTEAFYTALEGREADRNWQSLQTLLPDFLARFDAHMHEKSKGDSSLNRLRADILSHVRGKALEQPGLFTLTVPTGGGKTLASLGFALDHAKAHGHRRIIYAIPFTSITDQTAAIFSDLLGADHILEHHSAIDQEKFDPKMRSESRDKLKLAMEDWAAPVVVTTNVQLFESLFAAKTSRARKLHNIAGSVIILDEAQTIPRPLLKACMRMLDALARCYGCTIVLCTATQPALDQDRLEGGLPLKGRELAPDPHDLAQRLRRARIVHLGDRDNAALINALTEEPQALVIVNSRKHALELFREAQQAGLEGLVHLTTRQCAAHRKTTLADVRDRLKAGRPCRVIATSLIEAGVDVDFPKVWRAEAGLDQIVQAAGRCNREGKWDVEESVVSVFSARDYPPPSELHKLASDMKRVLGKHEDLLSLAAIEDYFGEVYWRMGDKLDAKGILGQFTVTRSGTDFAYRTVAEKFQMIESGMTPVIIPLDAIAQKAVDELEVEGIFSGTLARKLQTYVVQVPPKARDILIRNGHVDFARADLRGDQFAVLKTASLYHADVGLMWDDGEYLAAEQSIF
ncbi:CRISPR-associated helicase Cas3' [Allorhizobium terrae]|uniref:CRISPR-associated helicase Cas3 n=1 Tax=Allorhizobium terrae TaxID=1848972 RepID=A0A4S3ZXW3_9HYPH|nr:CRISPR-associated helicase Cas3' [Allorhizobium terrae]THF50755.1 CRISPR-associated helicase Cas3' [Allorhizobium terrae]